MNEKDDLNMYENLDALAHRFITTSDFHVIKQIVSQALTDPQLDDYINHHRKGWLGVSGTFSKHMARVLEPLKLFMLQHNQWGSEHEIG